MSEDSHEVLSWPVGRPFGVWVLTGFDGLIWGVLPILAGFATLVSTRNLDATTILGSRDMVSPIVRDSMDYMVRGMYRSFMFEAVLNLLLGFVILIAAVGSWKGNDSARKLLLGAVTMYGIRFVLQGGTVALMVLLIVGLHWWYLNQTATLDFYDQSGNTGN